MKLSDFDIDFRAGQAGEQSVATMLSIDTVEVKTDLQWHKTGNLYIETEYFSREEQRWVHSGISTTKATHWAFELGGVALVVPTKDLRDIVWQYGSPIACNVPPNPSRGFLIKVIDILQFVKERKDR